MWFDKMVIFYLVQPVHFLTFWLCILYSCSTVWNECDKNNKKNATQMSSIKKILALLKNLSWFIA